jgi:hypothetical protein
MSKTLLQTILGPVLQFTRQEDQDVPVPYRTLPVPPAPVNVNGPVGGPTGGSTNPTGNTPTNPIPII